MSMQHIVHSRRLSLIFVSIKVLLFICFLGFSAYVVNIVDTHVGSIMGFPSDYVFVFSMSLTVASMAWFMFGFEAYLSLGSYDEDKLLDLLEQNERREYWLSPVALAKLRDLVVEQHGEVTIQQVRDIFAADKGERQQRRVRRRNEALQRIQMDHT